MQWTQTYDPFGHWWLSTLVAALPIMVLFGLLAGLRVKPHWCAIAGASTAVAVAIIFFKMPPLLAALSFGYGVAFGVLADCPHIHRSTKSAMRGLDQRHRQPAGRAIFLDEA